MRPFYYILSICFIISCNQESKKSDPANADSGAVAPRAIESPDSLITNKDKVQADTILLQTSRTILQLLKQKDFDALSAFVHPAWQLRFSPYSFIDTTQSLALSPYELLTAAKKTSILHWGSYDGTGDPIKMNISQYFDKFVYKKDYLNAKETAINKFIASGNSLNNLKNIYPVSDFTEFYFPGFDPQYSGMDWQTLRLVFRKENNKLYLIAIVHDQWTS